MYKIIGSVLCIMYIVGNIWPIGFLISQGYIYGGFSRAVLRSVSLGGGFFISQWVFPFPKLDFPFPNMDFLCRTPYIYCPRTTGHGRFALSFSRSISRCRCLCSCDPGDRRPAQRVQTATGRAWQSVCVAFAERGQSVRAGAVTAADSRLTAGPLQSPCPSRRLAYSSSVVRAHNVRGG